MDAERLERVLEEVCHSALDGGTEIVELGDALHQTRTSLTSLCTATRVDSSPEFRKRLPATQDCHPSWKKDRPGSDSKRRLYGDDKNSYGCRTQARRYCLLVWSSPDEAGCHGFPDWSGDW